MCNTIDSCMEKSSLKFVYKLDMLGVIGKCLEQWACKSYNYVKIINYSCDFSGGSKIVGVCICKVRTLAYLYPFFLYLIEVAVCISAHAVQIPDLFKYGGI